MQGVWSFNKTTGKMITCDTLFKQCKSLILENPNLFTILRCTNEGSHEHLINQLGLKTTCYEVFKRYDPLFYSMCRIGNNSIMFIMIEQVLFRYLYMPDKEEIQQFKDAITRETVGF